MRSRARLGHSRPADGRAAAHSRPSRAGTEFDTFRASDGGDCYRRYRSREQSNDSRGSQFDARLCGAPALGCGSRPSRARTKFDTFRASYGVDCRHASRPYNLSLIPTARAIQRLVGESRSMRGCVVLPRSAEARDRAAPAPNSTRSEQAMAVTVGMRAIRMTYHRYRSRKRSNDSRGSQFDARLCGAPALG